MTYGNNMENKINIKETINLKTVPGFIEKNDPYREFDIICAELNKMKYEFLKKTRLANMCGVVESTLDFPIVGTVALDTCYGILFYDRENKKGYVGHAAPSGLSETLATMISLLDRKKPHIIEFLIVSGFRNVDRRDYSGELTLLNDLLKTKIPGIKFVPFKGETSISLHQPTLSYQFAFDTLSGSFVNDVVFFDEVDNNPRFISHRKYFK